MDSRRHNGQFAPGVSGNPKGRPKKLHKLAAAAREHTDEALGTIVDVMRTGKPSERLNAAVLILDRGWGKPTTMVEASVQAERVMPVKRVTDEEIRAKLLGIAEELGFGTAKSQADPQ